MALLYKLLTLCSTILLASAQLNYNNPRFVPEYEQTQSTYTLVQEPRDYPAGSIAEALLSSEFQPPSPDAPRPFFVQEPSEELKAPTKEAVIFSYDQDAYPPMPAEELQLPSVEKWNPNNDPALYYPTEIPTKLYPKKYNKNLDKAAQKTKALLTDEELVAKKKLVDKVLLALAKQENKKRLEEERQEQELQESRESFEEQGSSKAAASTAERVAAEPQAAESGFVGHNTASAATHGLSHDGNRMEFQVHGQGGPKTYKWGFDTGKGYNRQFRYEERDKDGIVKGHYGYYDKHGKLRIVNYDSHPHEGFHAAEANVGEEH